MEAAFTQSLNRKKVVVIEDDPVWQQIIRHCLLNLDRTTDVKVVSNAAEFRARRQFNEGLDLIIADQHLGDGATGLDLWQELQGGRQRTPFLLTSGIDKREFLALVNGATSPPTFAAKSLADGSLVEGIRKLLGYPPKVVVKPADKMASDHRLMVLVIFLIGGYGGMLLLTNITASKRTPSTVESHVTAPAKLAPAFEPQVHPTRPSITENAIAGPQTVEFKATAILSDEKVSSQLRTQLDRILKRAGTINAQIR